MRRASYVVLAALAGGCASAGARQASKPTPQAAQAAESSSTERAQYPSSYRRHPNPPVVIRNATIMTATGQEIANGSLLMKDGKIVAIGKSVDAPADAAVVDGTGKYVTPGLIDDHSHLGVYAAPGTDAESDGNEATNPITAEVWAEHSFWPQDPQIPLAIAGGITTIQALPGSANLIGGRSAILKLIPARTVQEMKFPGARYGLKMACGENPKRVYGRRGGPATRMGNMAGYRSAFTQAETYRRRWHTWRKDHKGDPPERNLRLETLAEVLRGNMYVQNHCYRADEMAQMIDLAHEFGFKIRSFHHAVESYKIADLLAKEGTSVSVWADWWGFKEEAMDGVQQNAALNQQAGGRPIIHSDDPGGIQRLNQEAAKAMYAGNAPASRSRATRPCGGSRSTLPGPLGSTRSSEHSSPARWPTWWCGPAIRSRSIRRPCRSTTTAGSRTTARILRTSRAPISNWARCPRPGATDDRAAARPGHCHHGWNGLSRLRSEARQRERADPRRPHRRRGNERAHSAGCDPHRRRREMDHPGPHRRGRPARPGGDQRGARDARRERAGRHHRRVLQRGGGDQPGLDGHPRYADRRDHDRARRADRQPRERPGGPDRARRRHDRADACEVAGGRGRRSLGERQRRRRGLAGRRGGTVARRVPRRARVRAA